MLNAEDKDIRAKMLKRHTISLNSYRLDEVFRVAWESGGDAMVRLRHELEKGNVEVVECVVTLLGEPYAGSELFWTYLKQGVTAQSCDKINIFLTFNFRQF